MKKILTILTLLFSVFSFAQNGTKITAPLVRNSPSDQYYIPSDTTMFGGLKCVYDTTSRNEILADYPLVWKNGSFVYCYLQRSMYMLDSTASPVWVLQWATIPGSQGLFGLTDTLATSARLFNSNHNLFVIENQASHFETIDNNGTYGIAIGSGGSAGISVGSGGSMTLSGISDADGSSLSTLFQSQLSQSKTWTTITDTSDYNATLRLKYQPLPSYVVSTNPAGVLSYSGLLDINQNFANTDLIQTGDRYYNAHNFNLVMDSLQSVYMFVYNNDSSYTEMSGAAGSFGLTLNTSFPSDPDPFRGYSQNTAPGFIQSILNDMHGQKINNSVATDSKQIQLISSGNYGASNSGIAIYPDSISLQAQDNNISIYTDSSSGAAPNFLGSVNGRIERYPVTGLSGNFWTTNTDQLAGLTGRKSMTPVLSSGQAAFSIVPTGGFASDNTTIQGLHIDTRAFTIGGHTGSINEPLVVDGGSSIFNGSTFTSGRIYGDTILPDRDTLIFNPSLAISINDTAGSAIATFFNFDRSVYIGSGANRAGYKFTVNGTSQFLDSLFATNFNITGVSGNGYVHLSPQSSNPATPSSGSSIFADASGRFGWVGASGFSKVFSGSGLTGNRVYTLFDSTDTIAAVNYTQTFTNKTIGATNTLGAATTSLGSDATGDLYYRNSSGILARLGIGTARQKLGVSAGLPAWVDSTSSGSAYTAGRGITLTGAAFGLDTAQTYTWANQIIQKNAIGANRSDGLLLRDTTIATNGNQQYSPAIHFSGKGFASTGGTSQSVDFHEYVMATQGTTAAGGSLNFDIGLNGATPFNGATLGASGTWSAITLSANGGNITSTTDRIVAANPTAATAGAAVQWSGRFRQTANTWNTTALASQPVTFYNEVVPVSTNPVSGAWNVMSQTNNGTALNVLSITNTGAITGPGTLTIGSIAAGTGLTGVMVSNSGTVNQETLQALGAPKVVSRADLAAQTSAGTVVTYTNGANDSSFDIEPYLTITAVTTDVVQMQVTYTPAGTSSTVTAIFYSQGTTTAGLSAAGTALYPPMVIRAKASTVITVATALTPGLGTITFNAGARIVEVP